MKAICTSIDPRGLADHQQSRVNEFESDAPLTVGAIYSVLGMEIVENRFVLLVRDDTGTPCFAAAGFFETFDAPLPAGWAFSLRSGVHASGRQLWVNPGVAVWGYPELVNDPLHAGALEEGEPEAIEIFNRRLREVSDH